MYKEYLNFTIDLIEKIGELQLSYFRSENLGIEMKTNVNDLVSRVDKESEDMIVKAILERYPDHKILGEEGGYNGNENSDFVWIVDPLDGTTNFTYGLPVFGISIALQYKSETIVGAVFAPYLDELFVAQKGGGAYLRTRSGDFQEIKVSQTKNIKTSLLGTGFPYDKDIHPDNNAENVARILPNIRDIRRMGSAAYDLCCVACGMLDGYWEMGLKPWDVCAGNLIVKQAGGIIHYFRADRGIAEIAGNTVIVDEIQKYIV